jgi:hypothetical protein
MQPRRKHNRDLTYCRAEPHISALAAIDHGRCHCVGVARNARCGPPMRLASTVQNEKPAAGEGDGLPIGFLGGGSVEERVPVQLCDLVGWKRAGFLHQHVADLLPVIEVRIAGVSRAQR